MTAEPAHAENTSSSPNEIRAALAQFVERDLVGPAGGIEELLGDQPRVRYVAGVLFPQESVRNESAAAAGVEDREDEAGIAPEVEVIDSEATGPTSESPAGSSEDTSSEHDDIVTLANSYRPSAMGLSFMVGSDVTAFSVQAQAATYAHEVEQEPESEYTRSRWRRHPLSLAEVPVDIADVVRGGTPDRELAEGLYLRCVARPRNDGRHLVTLSLYNKTVGDGRTGTTFFQVGMRAYGIGGTHPFVEYQMLEGAPIDDEELALQMLYRNRRIFAVGHGCASDWENLEGERAGSIETSTLPAVVVPPVEPHGADWRGLSMEFLAGACAQPQSAIPEALEEVCTHYQSWIQELEDTAPLLADRFRPSAAKHVALCRTALDRMRAGVRRVAEDPISLRAFMLANRAILTQQHHSRLRRKLQEPWVPLPESASDYRSDWDSGRGYWRTFQLAFILMILPGVDSDDERVELDDTSVSSRELVDLIWFPTGGGKTEAYLGATAYTIFRDRLLNPGSSGCRVLMRYTLRLLTSQQFQRAASLICACELIRRETPADLGDEPVSIGLWVGMSLTPNEEKDALRKLSYMAKKPEQAKNPFQLLTCPWCGTELDDPTRFGYSERRRRMIFQCPGEGCPFSPMREPLPVCVVDESIYERPPTLIIGTVDKFAMLAWREGADAILTAGGGPELIIQDELHLISGPLGSMVGLYESVIDHLCSAGGRKPKIVASTATIRRADEQCHALYGRPMFQFPPAGLDASDSFFARENTEAPGRLYFGCLPTAASSPLTAQIRSVVALQQGLTIVGSGAADHLLDPYWTLIQYFGSLKELGRAATFVSADIPEFLPTMHRRYELEGDTRRWMRTSEELTSRKNEEEIPKILKRLEKNYEAGKAYDEQALDTVLATNMISVGVDVDRLGLMMIVTQPKGTSEYIQASSRVGRSAKGPGFVFTLYNAARPRDRSHYEHFRGYHESFYRFVEPTSVTPYSPPAMERALHAVLVIAGRHIAKWKKPSDFDPLDPAFRAFLDSMRERVRRIDPDHEPEFEDLLERRLQEWAGLMPQIWGRLVGDPEESALMQPAGTMGGSHDRDVWATPTSMRNVDVECEARVVPAFTWSTVEEGE